jgi:hypothetical protein
MSDKWKSISHRQKTIVTKIRLSQIEKRERIVDVGRNVRFAHRTVGTIHDNADRITESDKSGTEAFV